MMLDAQQPARPPALKITLAQLAILLPAGLCMWAVAGTVGAFSLVSGGLVAVIPQAYFAAKALRWHRADAARAIAQAAYGAEIGKFLLSIAGFATVFALLRPIHGPSVFLGYIGMVAVQIVGSWWLIRR